MVGCGETISFFSFGSGCAATNFILKKVRNGMEDFDIEKRLEMRNKISFDEYKRILTKYFPMNLNKEL